MYQELIRSYSRPGAVIPAIIKLPWRETVTVTESASGLYIFNFGGHTYAPTLPACVKAERDYSLVCLAAIKYWLAVDYKVLDDTLLISYDGKHYTPLRLHTLYIDSHDWEIRLDKDNYIIMSTWLGIEITVDYFDKDNKALLALDSFKSKPHRANKPKVTDIH